MFLGYSRLKFVAGTAAVACASALAIMACSGGTNADGGSTAAALTVSGGFSSVSMMQLAAPKAGQVQAQAVTDYTMVCNILVDPFTSGSSALASDGSFSLSIEGGAGQPIGCMLVKSGVLVAAVQFTTSDSSMTGATGGSALAVNSGATTISFPTDLSISGNAISVPVANVTQNSSTAPTVTWADPTGTWSISKVCQSSITSGGKIETSCNGAQADGDVPTSVYLKQLEATDGTHTRTGLSIWKDATARTACGDKEGVKLEPGWTTTGNWDGTFGGGGAIDVSTTGKVTTLAANATIRSYNGQFICGATLKVGGAAIVSGTTKCSEVDFTGGGWGMGEDACRLYCLMNSLQDEDQYNWGGACGKRYKVRWENNRELATDKTYGTGANTPGLFAAGTCAYSATFDGCKSGTTVLFEANGAVNQYVIGELFISGNIGTVMKNEHDNWTFWDSTANGGMGADLSCGGTRLEKITMTQSSSTSATVSVEHNFIADSANPAGCATHPDFARIATETNNMVLKMTKQ